MVAHNAAYWARRKTESRQLSEADRLELVAAYQRLGKNVAAAARDRKVSKTAAARWIGQWLRTGSIVSTKRGNSGRPRTATSPAVVAKVVKLMNSPADGEHVPSAREVKRKLKLPFSDESVRKAAKRGGFKFRRKRNRPYLTAKQRLARLRWARAMLRVRLDWRRAMCTDEKLFLLEEGQRSCWMTDALPRFCNKKQYPKQAMIWGGISLLGSTDVGFIDGRLDATGYQKVLQKHLLPVASKTRGPWHFQQDGATVHTAPSTMTWLAAQRVPLPIDWASHAPDITPIENLWALMVLDLNKSNPGTVEDLKAAIRRSWRTRTGDAKLMESLLGTWRKRLVQVVEAEGGSIPY